MNRLGELLILILLPMYFSVAFLLGAHLTFVGLNPTPTMVVTVPIPVFVMSQVPSSIRINGQIDDNVSLIIDVWAAQVVRVNPQSVTIYMESGGGDYGSSLEVGRAIRQLQAHNIEVRFVVVNKCYSACFLISTFADQVYATKNSTLGFNHQPAQFSGSAWTEYTHLMASNKGWSIYSTNEMMSKTFNATEAIKSGVIKGIWG